MSEEPTHTVSKIEMKCPFCHAIFPRAIEKQERFPIQFCAYCGTRFVTERPRNYPHPSYIHEHLPDLTSPPLAQVGRYSLLKSIGKGGMGEVFLSYDTVSGRRVALKRIRSDLVSSPVLRKRFIREARITSQLIHPTIIPIFDIHIDKDLIYYTMPYVEGETLRHLLKHIKFSEDTGSVLHQDIAVHTSLQSLMRIFLNIAQAVAFAHSRGVLHRDLKPENVIIGTYGQVIILDWGLTKLLEEQSTSEEDEEKDFPTPNHSHKKNHLTKVGKLVGTLAYMAPEKAQGLPSSIQTDIYALGVVLYQILTLTIPFSRKSISEFQAGWEQEKYTPPEVRAPHRDVPQSLSEIVKKCLAKDPMHRFRTVDELITHIEGYLEGRSEWTESSLLALNKKSDWSFEEHVLLTEHSAISTPIDHAQWCRILISKDRFSDNVQISAHVTLHPNQQGIGFLIGVPEEDLRHHILDGYCIWLSSSETNDPSPSKILRHGISILELPDVVLHPNITYHVRIERIDRTISVWVDEEFIATKTSFLPVIGEFVGILMKDAQAPLESISVSSGSINILVNRLAVPDAFLANFNFDQALHEYRKIAALFPGHYEGREALFRSGVCLLEKADHSPNLNMEIYDSALDEFAKLKNTPGAPLEYLGKSLVYHSLAEYDEEVKCFELAFMRFQKHPLLHMISESLVERMHEMSRSDRRAAYSFISLVLRKLPTEMVEKRSTQTLFQALERSWEVPSLFMPENTSGDRKLSRSAFCLNLAFWLQKCYLAHEIFHELIQTPVLPKELLYNSCVTLYLSCATEFLKPLLRWKNSLSEDERNEFKEYFHLFEFLLDHEALQTSLILPKEIRALSNVSMRCFAMDRFNSTKRYDLTLQLSENIPKPTPLEASYILEAMLHEKMVDEASSLLFTYPKDLLNQESSPLFFWYGVILCALEGIEKMETHFQSVLDTPTPRSWLLGAHVLIKKLPLHKAKTGWLGRSFPYEREMLLRQIRVIDRYIPRSVLVHESLEVLQNGE